MEKKGKTGQVNMQFVDTSEGGGVDGKHPELPPAYQFMYCEYG